MQACYASKISCELVSIRGLNCIVPDPGNGVSTLTVVTRPSQTLPLPVGGLPLAHAIEALRASGIGIDELLERAAAAQRGRGEPLSRVQRVLVIQRVIPARGRLE